MPSIFKSSVSNNVGTAPVDLYTTPASTVATIIGLSVANVSGSTIQASVTITKGVSVAYLVKNAPVPVGGALVLFGGDQKLVLEAANKITITTNTATSADVAISYLEIT